MGENIRLDSHKLILHPKRVAEWMDQKKIYPLELEIGLSRSCNHRCKFCAVDYMEYKPVRLDKTILLNNLKEIAPKGLKSIVFAGEGEPLLHKDAPEIIAQTKSFGIDAAMSTNGAFLSKEAGKVILPALTWIRFSMAAGTPDLYSEIQGAPKGDFQKVLSHIEDSVALKRDKKLKVTLGAQMVLLPENMGDAVALACTLKELGVDYFTIKPYSQHPSSINRIHVDYQAMLELERVLQEIRTPEFAIYFRSKAMSNVAHEKTYHKCLGLRFMSYLDAKGDLYPCIAHMGNADLCYGNLNEKSFTEIWESPRFDSISERFEGEFLHSSCRQACRLDEINHYLTELKSPGDHANFI